MLTYCSFIQVKRDGPDDPTNPHNWPTLFRWAVTILTSCGGFITMMSGSMTAPALPAPSHDLHMSEASAQLTLSIFLLAFAFGPMLLAPFTELYGRRPVWLICGVFYSVWSIVSGFSPNKGTLVASRLLSGFGRSVDFVVSCLMNYDDRFRSLTSYRLPIPSEAIFGNPRNVANLLRLLRSCRFWVLPSDLWLELPLLKRLAGVGFSGS